jgi:hypothetical protein
MRWRNVDDVVDYFVLCHFVVGFDCLVDGGEGGNEQLPNIRRNVELNR